MALSGVESACSTECIVNEQGRAVVYIDAISMGATSPLLDGTVTGHRNPDDAASGFDK